MRLALGRQAGQALEDFAAALALRAQQRHVLAVARIVAERLLHLLGDQRDGGERRAELVRGGGGEPVERRQMLLALQHQFGGGERVGEQPRLLGDAQGIDAGEGDRGEHRHPHAGDIDERHGELACPEYQGSGRW